MPGAIAIIGQSNASNLWNLGGINTFSSALNAATGQPIPVIRGAVGGASLLKSAAQAAHLYWLGKDDAASPLYAFLQNGLSDLGAVWWVQGEQEAAVGVSEPRYLAGLVELQAIIAGAKGCKPAELPFIVSPLGHAARYYPGGWTVRNAHFGACGYPGFVLGPEYIDLEVESDQIHLTAAARETFAKRGAAAVAKIIGKGESTTFSDSFNRDISLASGTQTVSGLPFTPARVAFSAALGPYTSTGIDDGSDASCVYVDCAAGGGRSDASIYIYAASSGNGHKGRVSAFPENAFTVDWTKIGAGNGTATINYTAYK